MAKEVKETKKTTKKVAKKSEPKKAVKRAEKKTVTKMSAQDYIDVINHKKWDAHNINWLYIELTAGDLMAELEPGVTNVKAVNDAMLDTMLEGDAFLTEVEKASKKLSVRYYCDNLDPSRRKYADVSC